MIEIRGEQYSAFEDAEVSEFCRRVILHLKEDLGEFVAGATDEQLTELVQCSMKRARKYALETEFEIVCFIDTVVLLRDLEFDTNPNHHEYFTILNDPHLSSECRAERMAELAGNKYIIE